MKTKFYEIRKTDAFRDAQGVYLLLPENYRYRIESLVSKEIHAALLFNKIIRKIEDYCCKFFECAEHGFSYELGCYFQKREYKHEGFIKSDIDKFKALMLIYNQDKFPKEYKLIQELINDLEQLFEDWSDFEKDYPELFYKED